MCTLAHAVFISPTQLCAKGNECAPVSSCQCDHLSRAHNSHDPSSVLLAEAVLLSVSSAVWPGLRVFLCPQLWLPPETGWACELQRPSEAGQPCSMLSIQSECVVALTPDVGRVLPGRWERRPQGIALDSISSIFSTLFRAELAIPACVLQLGWAEGRSGVAVFHLEIIMDCLCLRDKYQEASLGWENGPWSAILWWENYASVLTYCECSITCQSVNWEHGIDRKYIMTCSLYP